MNPLDIVIIIIVGFCLIRGIFRGLVKELSSIIGVVAGFYAAYSYYHWLAKFLSRWISNPAYQNIAGFFILFCGVLLTIGIVAVIIKYLLNIAYLGWLDRICGAGFGLMKGVLISAVLLITLTAFLPKGAPVVKNSFLAPSVILISENLAKVVSKEMKQQFQTKIKDLKESWKTR